MAPVAKALSSDHGILEPLQTADSVQGQIDELAAQITRHAKTPVTLIGFSWGAWLCYLTTARYPECVKKLVLIGSGPFEPQYAKNIQKTRMGRLGTEEQKQVNRLVDQLTNSTDGDQNRLFCRFGRLISKADAYDPIEFKSNKPMVYNARIFHSVWPEADALRQSGGLLAQGKKIQCPVIAIHGDYDPHPARGVQEPLSRILDDFRFILLEKCGHKPWIEKQARERFFRLLREEIE
jgi:pimeloyl-ACP methyl ester carboxylesterase